MEDNGDTEQGQVAIGTLIVFIAMVLVASIAAGVMIETAGFLQSQSETTGERSMQQVTDRLQIVSTVGFVSNNEDGDAGNEIEHIWINVRKAPGAGDIDLEEATIHFIGPSGAADLTYGSEPSRGGPYFGVDAVKGTVPTLTNDTDVMQITILFDDDSDALDVLEAGDSATLDITTGSGGTTRVHVRVPNSLSGDTFVET